MTYSQAVGDEEEFALSTSLGELRLRRNSSGAPLSATERELVEHVSITLRTGLEWRESAALELGAWLARVLLRDELLDGWGLSAADERRFEQLSRDLTYELSLERIRVRLARVSPLRERDEGPGPELEPLPPTRPEEGTTFFEVRLLDETGQAIANVEVEFDCDGDAHEVMTNAAGVALLEGVTASTATVRVPDTEAIEAALELPVCAEVDHP